MKKKRIIYHIKPINIPKINYKPILFFIFFLLGLLTGVICIKYGVDSLIELASDIFEQSRMEDGEKSTFEFFFSDFLSSVCFLLASFIVGLCALGIPFLPVIPFIKGVYLGALGGYMYTQYQISGVGYCALIIYPGAALMLAALIYGCTESMLMSLDICSILLHKQKGPKANTLKLYCIRYGVLIFIALLAAIINTVSFKIFAGHFTFD